MKLERKNEHVQQTKPFILTKSKGEVKDHNNKLCNQVKFTNEFCFVSN